VEGAFTLNSNCVAGFDGVIGHRVEIHVGEINALF
jgi:hypothetical protein